ncbi:MAG: prohibitin family protein [Myxococcales bacterium]|nr:prohibitin family protein [Myxococcales bacterium]
MADADDELLEPAKKTGPGWRSRIYDGFTALRFYVYTLILVLALALGFLWPRMFITVPAGHHAVMYRHFQGGTVTNRIWGEGFHVIPPWDQLTIYESRLQQQTLNFTILSDEGLDLEVTVSVRFRPRRDQLGYLHQDIGPDYFERLIRPEVEAHVRRTFGNRPAHEIYSSAKDVLQELRNMPMITRIDSLDSTEVSDDWWVGGEAITSSSGRPELGYIDVQEIKLVDIDLPELVKAAIADKYRQEQLKLEYTHRIAREEQEAARKRIEAAGIRDFNSIAGEISPDLLRWRDIDATRELAAAPNSKVVVLGNSGGQTPLLFSLGEPPGPAAAPTTEPQPVPKPEPADDGE